MKTKTGMAAATFFITAASLIAGFFMPDLAGRAADQNLTVQTEIFAIEKIPSAANAKLPDMLKLSNSYANEVYLNRGDERDESEIETTVAYIISRLSEYKVLDKIRYGDISVHPFIAVRGEMLSDAAFGYADMDNAASTGDAEGNTSDVSGQRRSDDNVQMGILWNCSVNDLETDATLDMLIDDRSGKLLSFAFTRSRSYPGTEESGSQEESVGAIQRDLQARGLEMRDFCEEYYGFRHVKTESYIEGEPYFVRMYFEDENGDAIVLDLKCDQTGTWYSWN